MADRSVSVRLRLINSEYRKGMAEAVGDTTKFAAATKGAFSGLGDQLKQAGSTMSRNVTLPLTGLGLAATKLGNDFETTFAHMVGLANVPAGEIDGLRDSVMKLSAETARSPQELAEALYYIRSSGISAAKSLDVLHQSGQAAAAGLGSTQDIAKAVGFAINAYGENNLSAAKATDILVATIREGTIEAGELAPVMGTLIPTASALGISFDQVAGTMAVMSKNGADASDSATGLSAVMSTLLGTSKEGTQLLEAHGLSLKQLRDIAAGPGGLVAVFRTLDQSFKGNDEALATIIPNIRALRTFMNVLSQDGSKVDATLKAVTNSAGATASAFDAVAQTDAFKQQQALTDAKIALVQLGAALAPLLTLFAQVGGSFAGAFGSMPAGLQTVTIAMGLLLAATGPLLRIGGAVAANFATISNALTAPIAAVQRFQVQLALARAEGVSTGTAMKLLAGDVAAAGGSFIAVAGPIIAVTATVGILVNKWSSHKAQVEENRAELERFTKTLYDAADAATGTGEIITTALANKDSGDDKYAGIAKRLREAGVSADDLTKAVLGGDDAINQLKRDVFELSKNGGNLTYVNATEDGKQLNALIAQYRTAAIAAEELRRARIRGVGLTPGVTIFTPGDLTMIGAAEAALHTLPPPINETADAAAKADAELKAMLSTFDGLYDKAFGVLDANLDYADALNQVGKSSDTAASSTRNLVSEQHAAQRAAEAITLAQLDLAKAEAALVEARKGPSDRETHDAGLDVREATLGLAEAQKSVADAQKKVTEERKKGKEGDVKGATLDLQRAQIALVRAQDRVTDSRAKQNEVLGKGAETTDAVKDAVDAVSDAQLRLRDAQWAQEESQEKSIASTGRAVDKQKELAGQIDTVISKGDAAIRKMIEMGTPGGEVLTAIAAQATAIQGIIDKYGDANGKLRTQLELLLNVAKAQGLAPTVNPETGWIYYELPKSVPGKAAGGAVDANTAYVVGEHGPELAVFGRSGSIIPNHQLTSGIPQGQLAAASNYASTSPTVVIKPSEVAVYLDGDKIGTGVVRWSQDIGGAEFKVKTR